MRTSVRDRVLVGCVVLAAVLTACCPLYFASYLIRLYRSMGQPLVVALPVAKGALLYTAAYLVAAVVYWFAPRLRPVLAALAVVAAGYAISQAPTYWTMVQNRNLFHNMLAEPMWEMFGRCAIALLAIAQLLVARFSARPAGYPLP